MGIGILYVLNSIMNDFVAMYLTMIQLNYLYFSSIKDVHRDWSHSLWLNQMTSKNHLKMHTFIINHITHLQIPYNLLFCQLIKLLKYFSSNYWNSLNLIYHLLSPIRPQQPYWFSILKSISNAVDKNLASCLWTLAWSCSANVWSHSFFFFPFQCCCT